MVNTIGAALLSASGICNIVLCGHSAGSDISSHYAADWDGIWTLAGKTTRKGRVAASGTGAGFKRPATTLTRRTHH